MTKPACAQGVPMTQCPVTLFVDAIGGKWKPLILFQLKGGSRRFNELRRLIPGATQRMLTLQLRELEADGFISRTVHAQVPPRVDYALTDDGMGLGPVLDLMAQWGLQRLGAMARDAA